MGIIRINYKEGSKKKDLGYESVSISFGDQDKEFSSGNFVKDWYDMCKFIINEVNDEPRWSYSSSVDHFIMDGANFDSAYLHMVDGKPVLKYIDRNDPNWYLTDIDNGVEFFVIEKTQPTWEELRKLCNDEKK